MIRGQRVICLSEKIRFLTILLLLNFDLNFINTLRAKNRFPYPAYYGTQHYGTRKNIFVSCFLSHFHIGKLFWETRKMKRFPSKIMSY